MVYVTGNVHADIDVFKNRVIRKLSKDDYLLICGDFGFIWECDDYEEDVLDFLASKKYTILFVDGTHENFTSLYNYPEIDFLGGKAHKIRDNIFHLMRGYIFNIDMHSYFAFGGGKSSDIPFYRAQGKYWEEEMPTLEEMQLGAKNIAKHNCFVDFIVTHEPPPKTRMNADKEAEQQSELTLFFADIEKNVKYRRWFYGADHVDKLEGEKRISLFYNVLPVDFQSQKFPKGKSDRLISPVKRKKF